MFIEFVGQDVAIMESYRVAYQRYGSDGAKTRSDITGGADTGDAQFDMMISGRYVDRVERRDGRHVACKPFTARRQRSMASISAWRPAALPRFWVPTEPARRRPCGRSAA